MAKLALIYGMRLLPVDDLGEVKEAVVVLKNGRTARVAMHLIEGSKEEIENTFRQSIDAFFEMYPEIWRRFSVIINDQLSGTRTVEGAVGKESFGCDPSSRKVCSPGRHHVGAANCIRRPHGDGA